MPTNLFPNVAETAWSRKPQFMPARRLLAGDVDVETERGVLVALARKKDILVEDEMMPVAKADLDPPTCSSMYESMRPAPLTRGSSS